jgi:hypothetical protein
MAPRIHIIRTSSMFQMSALHPRERSRLVWSAVLLVPLCCAVQSSWGDEATTTSVSPIRLNTIGYLPGAVKRATVAAEGGTGFVIRDMATGQRVFAGRLVKFQTGDEQQLAIADFSALDREGTYQIEVAGAGPPREFRVANDIYNWPLYCCLRAMYLWRCGTAVSGEFAGDIYQHGACHLEDAYLDHVGGPAGQRKDGTGGWHDAGDYNKYTVNAAFTVGMMLRAWEHFGDRLAALASDKRRFMIARNAQLPAAYPHDRVAAALDETVPDWRGWLMQ